MWRSCPRLSCKLYKWLGIGAFALEDKVLWWHLLCTVVLCHSLRKIDLSIQFNCCVYPVATVLPGYAHGCHCLITYVGLALTNCWSIDWLQDGATPLFKACHKGHVEVVLELLKYRPSLGLLQVSWLRAFAVTCDIIHFLSRLEGATTILVSVIGKWSFSLCL